MTKEQFTEQVLKSEEILFKVAMSMLKNEADAQDAVQSAILAAYERLNTLRHEEYFRTWLVRILINICKKQFRQNKRTAAYTEIQTPSISPQEEVEVRAAVESLPLKIRQTVILYYSEQFTTREIAQILKIPQGTVMSRLAKGRKLLHIALQ